ncbi:MAG: hypothetical protein GY771_07020 [bacterium]|nr:hypothetical protein [bacterium]
MLNARSINLIIAVAIAVLVVPTYTASKSCKPRALRSTPEYLATRTISDLTYGIRHNIPGLVTSTMQESARGGTIRDNLVDWDGFMDSIKQGNTHARLVIVRPRLTKKGGRIEMRCEMVWKISDSKGSSYKRSYPETIVFEKGDGKYVISEMAVTQKVLLHLHDKEYCDDIASQIYPNR